MNTTPHQARTVFRAQLVTLTILSLWRICTCLWEYDTGPFVSVLRTLLDQTSFWALAGLVAAYSGWRRAAPSATRLLLFSTSMLLIAAADIVIFNGTARERLYTGSWAGQAHVSFAADEEWLKGPALDVTFSADQTVVFVLGESRVPIYRGEWHMSFDPMRCSQAMTFSGFGRADYWNKEHMHVKGSFRIGDRSYRLSAQLKQVRKRSAS